MNQKKLEFSLKLDTAEFDKAVEKIQAKINRLTAPQEQMAAQTATSRRLEKSGLGGLSPASQEAYKKHTQQSKRDFDQMIMAQIQGQQKLEKVISQREQLLNKLKLKEKESITDAEKLLKIKETMSRVEENNFRRRESYIQRDAVLNQMVDLKNGKSQESRAGTGGGMAGMLKSGIGGLGIPLSAAAIAAAIGASVAKAVNTYIAAPTTILRAAGSSVENGIGYLNKDILSGDIGHEAMLQSQMGKGKELAVKQFDTSPLNKILKGGAAFSDSMLEQWNRQYGTHFDVNQFRNSFEAQRAGTITSDTLKNAQSGLKAQNSLLLGHDFFNNTFNRNLTAERALGLGTEQFKQMQMGVNNRGFLTDQALAMLTQVQNAGGSASGLQGTNIANLGLGMQRGFNITNAGGALGKLSGLYGSGSVGAFNHIDEASKRILEDAITKGFNKSENTEIIRKFVDASSNLVFTSEAKKEEDVDRITRDFSRMLSGNPTMKQFEGAKSAYDIYQSAGSQTAGRGGSLGLATMMQSGNFSKLNPLQMGNLLGLTPSQLTSTNSDIVSAATQQGVSPETMVTNLLQSKQEGIMAQIGLSDKGLAPLRKYLGKRNLRDIFDTFDKSGNSELKKMEKSNPAAFKSFQTLQNRTPLLGKFESDEARKEEMIKLEMGPAYYQKLGATTAATAGIATGDAGKKEAAYIAGQAVQEKELVKNLKAVEDQLYPTNDSLDRLIKKIVQLGSAAHLLSDTEIARLGVEYGPTSPLQTKDSMSRTPNNGSKPGASGGW